MIKRILVRCPVTKKLNVTGMTIEEDIFAGVTLKTKSVKCVHCDGTHEWNKQQVILAR